MPQSNTKSIIAVIFALFLGAGACVGTEIGNPQDDEESQVTVQVQGMELGAEGALTLSSGVEITEAWVVVEEVRFFTGAGCDQDLDSDFDTTSVVELISGTEYPGYDESTMVSGSYCRVEMTIGDIDVDDLPEEVPLEMQDRSILIRGTSPEGVAFELVYDSSETLELHGLFTLESNRQALFVIFALDQWLTPEQLDEVEEGENGLLLITDDTEPDILDEFVEVFLRSAILVRDENDDGVLQDAELSAALARGDNEPVVSDGDGDGDAEEELDDADDEEG